MSGGSLRLAWRLAARQARTHRLRAVAIVATLAVPVAVATAVDVVARTTTLTATEQAHRQLGAAAALVSWSGATSVSQAPNPSDGTSVVQAQPAPATGMIAGSPAPARLPGGLVPPGAIVTPEADATTYLRSDTQGTYAQTRGVDLRAAGPAQTVVIDAGRVPAGAGEAAVTPALAHQLRVGVGSVLTVPGSPVTLRMVGVVDDRYTHGDATVWTVASTALRLQAAYQPGGGFPTGYSSWFVATPAPITWPDVLSANRHGLFVISRWVIAHPPPAAQVPWATTAGPAVQHASTRTRNEVVALLGAMLLLEVILLAGPAFAVGARRRSHELAVLAASGASRRQLVAVVAGDGAVLGVLAAAAGATVGVAGASVTLAIMQSRFRVVPGPVTIHAAEVVGIAALAVVSGLVAALLPALAASRADTAQVLRGRQAPAPLSWRPAVAGAASIGIAGLLGITNLRSSSGGSVALVGAAALAGVGCALLTPAVLVLAGRAAPHLGVWGRLAVRDASRNRSAASPAVAAIVAVVAAATAVLVYGATSAARDRATFQPSVTVGDAVAYLAPAGQPGGLGPVDEATAQSAAQTVRRALPGAAVVELRITGGSRTVVVLPPARAGCPQPQVSFSSSGDGNGYSMSSGTAVAAGGQTPASCAEVQALGGSTAVLDDGSALRAILGGTAGARAAAALQAGRAVVFDPTLLAGGAVSLALGPGQPASAHLPALAVRLPQGATAVATVVLPLSEAPALHLTTAASELYVVHAALKPAGRLAAASTALEHSGQSTLYVQAGYHDRVSPLLLAVAGGDILLTLAAAVAATALVTADSAEELRILAAVGAGPSGRRRLAMSRAALIGGIGATFGALAGLLPGISLVWRLTRGSSRFAVLAAGPVPGTGTYPLHIPWLDITLIVVGAPLLAAAAAAAITRTRVDLPRRRTT